jgi:nucleotide-binding universal stress UspA family protein
MAVLMYKRILVCLENSATDQHITDHVMELARLCGAAVLLVHVADGWAARNIKQLDLRESEEMREDREYLERVAAGFVAAGVPAEALLATGDPAAEITAAAEREHCDLIAMATHGHRLIGDVIHGSVANAVRHRSMVPVLLVRAPSKAGT